MSYANVAPKRFGAAVVANDKVGTRFPTRAVNGQHGGYDAISPSYGKPELTSERPKAWKGAYGQTPTNGTDDFLSETERKANAKARYALDAAGLDRKEFLGFLAKRPTTNKPRLIDPNGNMVKGQIRKGLDFTVKPTDNETRAALIAKAIDPERKRGDSKKITVRKVSPGAMLVHEARNQTIVANPLIKVYTIQR